GLAGEVPAHLRAVRARRGAQAAVRARAPARQHARRRDRGLGRRPAPDVDLAVLALQSPLHLGELRGPGHDGLLGAGRDRRQGGPARPHGLGGRRRRLLPDDGAGAGHGHQRAHPREGGHPEQRLPGHGPPVAGDVLRRALQRGVPVARPARLQAVGRGHGLRGHAGRVAGGGRRRHPEGERDRRPAGRHRLPHRRAREGLPHGPVGPQQRPDRDRSRPRRGGPLMSPLPGTDARHHTLVVLVENRPGVLARVAGLFARRGYNIYSLAVAPTEDDRFSRITIVVDVASSPLEQITKQLFKLINVVKIQELGPDEAVERELLLATVEAPPEIRGQILELVSVYDGRVLDVSPRQVTVSVDDVPERVDDFEELLRPYGIANLQRTGR